MTVSVKLAAQCPNVPEICNNGIDDDCDGLIDCFDGDCSGDQSCADFYFGRDSGECEVAPPVVTGYNLVEVWRSDVSVETRGTPIVGDLDGDGIPEVVSHFRDDNTVYIIDGATGTTKYTINAHLSDYSQSPAIADVDGDGFGEVFLVDNFGKLKCFDHQGNPKAGFNDVTISKGQGTFQGVYAANPSFADFNGDGSVEIYIGNEIYSATTGALISNLPNHYNESKGAIGVNGHVFSAAYDILPDNFCIDCSGLELVCGNVVYSVNMATGLLTEVSRAPNSVNDGKVSLADWDGDNQMDIVVSGTCCGDGGVIYIWNPRTQAFVTQDAGGNLLQNNPFDVQPNLGNQVGLASIADFDGDGLLEIGMAGRHEFITVESNMTRKWAIPVVDQSNMTTSTAFDFEGDGKTEVVYRDENNLYIIDGATGNIVTQIPCGSGTRTELPIVVDVNGDGDAELVCTCSDTPGAGKGEVRVYESDSTIWVPTRKVWNTHNYVPTFINDNLTVPKEFQNKALIAGQDLYLAQTSLTYQSGNPVYPVLPDYTVSIDSVSKNCSGKTNTAHVKICMQTANALVFDFDVSFYNGNPTAGGTLIGTQRVDHSTSTIPTTGCMTITNTVDFGNYDLHVLVNDKGTDPTNAPIILMPECDTTNNSAVNSLTDCSKPNLIVRDTVSICKGDSILLQAIDMNNSTWSGDSLISINDSTVRVFPFEITTYNVTRLLSRADLLVNSDFENVNLAGTNAQLDASLVNGWSTTATDNKIEIWRNGFLGHPSYSGEFFAELNATQPSALYQDIVTVPGETVRWGFAHRGRITTETMQFKVGPSGGTYEVIGDYTDGPTAWGYYSGEYVVPAGQTLTRFLFSAVDQNASANLIDAATFEAFHKHEDSVVVVVNEPPIVSISDSTICTGDSVQLDAQNPNASFLWSTGETSQTIMVKSSGDYHVEVTDDNGCIGRDTMTLSIGLCATDLAVTKTDGVPQYQRGTNTVYTIVAKNNGPSDAKLATVTDPIPSGVNSFSWTASFFGTASNTAGVSGLGSLSDTVNLAVGDSIVYSVTAAISWAKFGELENMVIINTANGTFDLDSTNNIAVDVDADPDPSSCFILMTDFEDYVNCTSPSYDQFAQAYSGNSAWVNSNHTAGLFVNDPGNCTNIINGHVLPHTDGGTAYAGLHSPLNGNTQEVIIGTLPTKLFANQEYEISFIGVSIFVRNQAVWDEYGEVDFFGVEEGTNPLLNATTQRDYNAISAIPEVDHLGTSATVSSRTQWNEYSFKFTPARNYDRLLLAPRGNFAYVGIDNIIVKVAAQSVEVDTVSVCEGIASTMHPFDVTSGNPDEYSIDWEDAANAAGIADVAQSGIPVDSQFVVGNLTSVPAGTYLAEVHVFNTLLGCEGIDTMVLIINAYPNAVLPEDTAFCAGGSVVLDAGSSPNLNLQWSGGESTQTITVDSTGIYKLTVTNSFGCSDSDSVRVVVHDLPKLTLRGDTNVCVGESLSLNAKNSGSTYLWNTNETTQEITISNEGLYDVVVTDLNSCQSRDTMELILNPLPVIDLGNDTTVCEGDSVVVNAGVWKTILWGDNQTSESITVKTNSVTYVDITNENNCPGSDTIKVQVNPLPMVDLGNDTTNCEGDSIIIDAGNSGLNYRWSTGELTQTIEGTEGQYWVIVSDEIGCNTADSINISIEVIEDPFLKKDYEFCEGDSAELWADNNLNNYHISWPGFTLDSTLVIDESGVYSSLVTGQYCSESFELNGIMIDTPDVVIKKLSLLETVCFDYDLMELGAIGPNIIDYEFLWSTGGSESEIFVYEPGIYDVVTSYKDCEAFNEINVDEHCPGVLFIPNAFTPDGDGNNDVFTPKGDHVYDYRMRIYNRWGELLYTTESLGQGWDGNYAGNKAQQDVYVYKVEYTYNFLSGQSEQKSVVGTVALIR